MVNIDAILLSWLCAVWAGTATGFIPVPHGVPGSAAHLACSRRVPGSCRGGVAMQTQQAREVPKLSPRREQFFRMVLEGLAVGFEPGEVERVEKFVKYCRQELEPEPLGHLHQPSEEYIEGLRAQPWWDGEAFPWVEKIEQEAATIQEEFSAFMDNPLSDFAQDSMHSDVMGAGWSGVRLQRLGKWIPQNCDRFPKTTQLLKDLGIPIAVRGVMFARQKPGSGVGPHSDGRNFILTAHLGVDVPVPDKCWMRVGGERRGWENGKVLVLDTSFEHETGNESDKDRFVLIIDYWHPDLTEAEQAALAFVYDLRNRFESGEIPLDPPPHEEGGVLGAFKNLFGGG